MKISIDMSEEETYEIKRDLRMVRHALTMYCALSNVDDYLRGVQKYQENPDYEAVLDHVRTLCRDAMAEAGGEE